MRHWKAQFISHGLAASSLALPANIGSYSQTHPASVIMPKTDEATAPSQAEAHSRAKAPSQAEAILERPTPSPHATQQHNSYELLKNLPSPADDPANKASATNFMRARSQHIASRLANIEHCIYPVRRDAEALIDGTDLWESALAALDEQLSRFPIQAAPEQYVAETLESLEDPDGFEQDTAVLTSRLKKVALSLGSVYMRHYYHESKTSDVLD